MQFGNNITGLSDDTKRLVVSLFPMDENNKPSELDSMYKNAQTQIRGNVDNKSQKRKALDMLDLMYLSAMQDKR